MGYRVNPSPAPGACVREWDGISKSWHCPIPGRNENGLAIDVFIDGPLMNAFVTALQIPEFGGIGVYPYWKWPAKKLHGGLHLDIRPISGEKTIWWFTKRKKYKYLHSTDPKAKYASLFRALTREGC